MNNFFKKYWSHILNISFLVFLIAFFVIIANGMKNETSAPPPALFPVLLLVEVLMVAGIFAEIIYYMVKASKCEGLKNRGAYMALIYLLNIFYVPCFALKYIHKDSKATVKNIVYVVVSIALFIAFYILAFQTIYAQ